MKEHHVSSWWLIGLQLPIFGALIFGAGIYSCYFPLPPEQQTIPGNRHPAMGWGAAMLVLGIFYTVKFWPKRS